MADLIAIGYPDETTAELAAQELQEALHGSPAGGTPAG
jgi:hypothetical protein